MQKCSDYQIILEDIEEWLAVDTYKLEKNCRHKLSFDIYSKSEQQGGGLLISISATPERFVSRICVYLFTLLFCMVFILWIYTIGIFKIGV